MSFKLPAAIVFCAAMLDVSPALADRAPNPQELSSIENTLRTAGYASWDEIELDDGVWEVDDARRAENAQDCDVDISPQTYEIVGTDC